jgi:hypothetical protein
VAKRAKRADAPKSDNMDLIARLLALLVVKGAEKDDAVIQLGVVGFDDKTVSELLGVTESSIRGLRFRRQKRPKKKNKT